MSAMRIGLLLCSVLAVVCLAVLPTVQATAIAVGDGPVADELSAEHKVPVVPLYPIEVKPVPVSVPAAEYPEAVKKARIEGLAVIEALVDLDGSVIDVDIIRSSGNRSLDQAAKAAAGETKFRPASSLDRPGLKWVTIPYRFSLTSSKGIAPDRSISLVAMEPRAPQTAGKSYNDSVLKPLRGLRFVRLKPIAPRGDAHGRLVPDSAAIRFNNQAIMTACGASRYRQGDSLHKLASYRLQSDWYYVVIDSGKCRIFQRNHAHYLSSRAGVYDVDGLAARPDGMTADYMETPGWTELPQYVPLKLEFAVERMGIAIQAPLFRLGVQ